MNLISREELKAKLDRGDDFKLVMALGEVAYRIRHIPGSLHFRSPEDVLAALKLEDEIVVYCSGLDCMSSATAYYFLESKGYNNLRRYAGGLADWAEAGYPFEGERV